VREEEEAAGFEWGGMRRRDLGGEGGGIKWERWVRGGRRRQILGSGRQKKSEAPLELASSVDIWVCFVFGCGKLARGPKFHIFLLVTSLNVLSLKIDIF
jgi:hypothetical protein